MAQSKKWSRPELIVLARSNPEEAVLTFCKRIAPTSLGPADNQTGCDDGDAGTCRNCQARSGS